MLFREIIQDVIKKLRTWTIFATLRLSLEMLSLQSLQEERFDFAYSALYSKSSAILFWDWIRKETGSGPYFAFDWLKFRANFLTSILHSIRFVHLYIGRFYDIKEQLLSREFTSVSDNWFQRFLASSVQANLHPPPPLPV